MGVNERQLRWKDCGADDLRPILTALEGGQSLRFIGVKGQEVPLAEVLRAATAQGILDHAPHPDPSGSAHPLIRGVLCRPDQTPRPVDIQGLVAHFGPAAVLAAAAALDAQPLAEGWGRFLKWREASWANSLRSSVIVALAEAGLPLDWYVIPLTNGATIDFATDTLLPGVQAKEAYAFAMEPEHAGRTLIRVSAGNPPLLWGYREGRRPLVSEGLHRPLEAEEWLTLRILLDQAGFWLLEGWDSPARAARGGEIWTLEGLRGGGTVAAGGRERHRVERYRPDDPAILRLGEHFLALADGGKSDTGRKERPALPTKV